MALPYVPTTWKSGDLVSSTRLNKLEGGVKENSDAIVTNAADISQLKSEIEDVAVSTAEQVLYSSFEIVPNWENGLIDDSGKEVDNNYCVRMTAKIPVLKNTEVTAAIDSADVTVYFCQYNYDGTFTRVSGGKLTSNQNCEYFRLALYSTTVPQNQLASHVTITAKNTQSVQTALDMFDFHKLNGDDMEYGSIDNTTGEPVPFGATRARTKYFIPAAKGTKITRSVNFNVWEYDLVTYEHITNARAWVQSYTVDRDCYIKIMCYNPTEDTLAHVAESIKFDPTGTLLPVSMNRPFIDNVVKEDVKDNAYVSHVNYESVTVKTIAHRGDNVFAPQCTEPAYVIARNRGITIMENDLWKSQDGVYVMWHDTSLSRLGNLVDINGYAIYTDGTDFYYVDSNNAVYTFEDNEYVASAVALNTLTRCNGADYGVNTAGIGGATYDVIGLSFDQLRRIDFGAYKGEQFAGTQILTFEEWVLLCKQLGAEIYIDTKIDMTTSVLDDVAPIVKKLGMSKYASWLSISTANIPYLRNILPDARIGVLDHPNESRIAGYAEYNTGRGLFFDGNGRDMPSKDTIQAALTAGYEVEVYIVDYGSLTENEVFDYMKTAVSYGVTGITCDSCRVADAYKSLTDKYTINAKDDLSSVKWR